MKWQTLLCMIGFIGIVCVPAGAYADDALHPRGDGTVCLYSYHTDDTVEVTFRTATGYDRDALQKIYFVMRSRCDDRVHPISLRLIDLLDHIQDHFDVETVEIISGYRSKVFNEALHARGRGAANESLHTKGMAADIHLDEIRERTLWNYAKKLGAGGAGFYPRFDFVHVDVGPPRHWREPDAAERILVGLDNNPNPDWKITTNKNNYRRNEVATFTITSLSDSSKVCGGNAYLEKFRRGVWKKRKNIDVSARKLAAKDLPYGKYRIVCEATPPAYSNEFYIKKQ